MKSVVVAGAGILGVAAAIWLRRAGMAVTLIDRSAPGSGASRGNAGVLAACSVVPVTAPGLVAKAPGMLLDPQFPLFVRWSYLPRLAPWLLRYLGHANEFDTRRISQGLAWLTTDSIAQHTALAGGSAAEAWLRHSDYVFAYGSRALFEGDSLTWALRRCAGFSPEIVEGREIHDYDPALSSDIQCLAIMKDHGFVVDPESYVGALADVLVREGGRIATASLEDFDLDGDGRIVAALASTGRIECDAAVLATGVWSRPLTRKLGLSVPLESERGYHVVFHEPTVMPKSPTMIASGKFVATPMSQGLRCAGVVEFGGTVAGPSNGPLELLRKKAREAFPGLECAREEIWLGHRPAPADSLPLIGEIGHTGVYAAFGHHHIGLTAGPKTGRIVAGMISGQPVAGDTAVFDPNRFS